MKVLQDWLASNKNEGFTDGGSKGCMLALEALAGCRYKLKRFLFYNASEALMNGLLTSLLINKMADLCSNW